MVDPHIILIQPHITEKSLRLSMGDPRIEKDSDLVRKYTFVVADSANKIQIKDAVQAIYNEGKKDKDKITVTNVATIRVKGRMKRMGQRKPGMTTGFKKAIVTLAAGQSLEDYGA
jgi:large subunit ribosomal protein L23